MITILKVVETPSNQNNYYVPIRTYKKGCNNMFLVVKDAVGIAKYNGFDVIITIYGYTHFIVWHSRTNGLLITRRTGSNEYTYHYTEMLKRLHIEVSNQKANREKEGIK